MIKGFFLLLVQKMFDISISVRPREKKYGETKKGCCHRFILFISSSFEGAKKEREMAAGAHHFPKKGEEEEEAFKQLNCDFPSTCLRSVYICTAEQQRTSTTDHKQTIDSLAQVTFVCPLCTASTRDVLTTLSQIRDKAVS